MLHQNQMDETVCFVSRWQKISLASLTTLSFRMAMQLLKQTGMQSACTNEAHFYNCIPGKIS